VVVTLPEAGATKLQHLHLSARQVLDEGVKALAALTALRSLTLSYLQKVTDDGLISLINSLSELHTLSLEGMAKVGDASVAAFSHMPLLHSLHISGWCRVTDSGVSNLASMSRLHTLSLVYVPQVTPQGVQALYGLPNLCNLDVRL